MENEAVAELVREMIMARLKWEDKIFDTIGFWAEAWADEHNTVELLLGGSPDFFNQLDEALEEGEI